jgi:hypothetical protein
MHAIYIFIDIICILHGWHTVHNSMIILHIMILQGFNIFLENLRIVHIMHIVFILVIFCIFSAYCEYCHILHIFCILWILSYSSYYAYHRHIILYIILHIKFRIMHIVHFAYCAIEHIYLHTACVRPWLCPSAIHIMQLAPSDVARICTLMGKRGRKCVDT